MTKTAKYNTLAVAKHFFMFCTICILSCTNPVKTPIVEHPAPVFKNAIIAAYDYGHNSGIYMLDSDSLKIIDSIITLETPTNGAYSSTTNRMYYIWSSEVGLSLHEISLSPFVVTKSTIVQPYTRGICVSELGNSICTYGTYGLQLFSLNALSEIHYDSTIGTVLTATASPNSKIIYIATVLNRSLNGIFGYDIVQKKIIDTLKVVDSLRQLGMQTISLTTSIDGNYLYISGFNYSGFSGYNSFIVYDLNKYSTVNEFFCGQFAQLEGTKDGKYIYVSNPAGYDRGYPPTDTVYRFDISLKNFIPVLNSPMQLNLAVNHLFTDQMAIDDEHNILYLSLLSGLKNNQDKRVQIVGYDLAKSVPVSFFYPKDGIYGSSIPYSIRDISFVKFMVNN